MTTLKAVRYLVLAGAAFCLLVGGLAVGAERFICAVSVSTTAVSTYSVTACRTGWSPNASLAFQCPGLGVYYNVTRGVRQADGEQDATVATLSNSALVDFGINPDPYNIFLGTQEEHISFITASGTGTCRIFATLRR